MALAQKGGPVMRHRFPLLLLFLAAGSSLLIRAQTTEISATAMQQIRTLLQEKAGRTPEQAKLGSQLVYALKAGSGQLSASGLGSLPLTEGTLDINSSGVLVEIRTPAP